MNYCDSFLLKTMCVNPMGSGYVHVYTHFSPGRWSVQFSFLIKQTPPKHISQIFTIAPKLAQHFPKIHNNNNFIIIY